MHYHFAYNSCMSGTLHNSRKWQRFRSTGSLLYLTTIMSYFHPIFHRACKRLAE